MVCENIRIPNEVLVDLRWCFYCGGHRPLGEPRCLHCGQYSVVSRAGPPKGFIGRVVRHGEWLLMAGGSATPKIEDFLCLPK